MRLEVVRRQIISYCFVRSPAADRAVCQRNDFICVIAGEYVSAAEFRNFIDDFLCLFRAGRIRRRGDKQIRTLIEELVGYCFYRDTKLGKCFILTGEKNNGKSTFIFMLNTLLGDDNYSSVDITNLARELDIASLANKLANIKDDIADNYMDGLNVSLFKQVATGNRCRGKFLYNDPFDF